MQIAPLGPERDKQIGEKRGEKPECYDNHGRCPQWGQDSICTLAGSTCFMQRHLPYSSDLNVTMRLVDAWDGVFNLSTIKQTSDGKVWAEIEFYLEEPERYVRVSSGLHATVALAMIDAITKAYLEVKGE